VAKAFADFEGGGESLAGKFVFAEAEVGDAAEVEAVGFSPGVLAVGDLGTVECVAGVLECFVGVACGDVGFGEGEAEIDGVFSEAAGVGEEDAGFGFGDGLGEIAEVAVEFTGGVEAAELEVYRAGAIGKGAGVLKVHSGLAGIIGEEHFGKEGVAATESVIPIVSGSNLPVDLGLTECTRPLIAKELGFCLMYSA